MHAEVEEMMGKTVNSASSIMTGGSEEINKATIARCDPCIEKILETSSQVALYQFAAGGHSWEKTDTEGCLFIYERSAEPRYSFLIMNRQNPSNFIEPVTGGLELNMQSPYLFYKKPQGSIHGLWFYVEKDCVKTYRILEKLIKQSSTQVQRSLIRQHLSATPSAFKPAGKQTLQGRRDIMQMLSKAQSDYQKTSSKPEAKSPGSQVETVFGNRVVRPTPLRILQSDERPISPASAKDSMEVQATASSDTKNQGTGAEEGGQKSDSGGQNMLSTLFPVTKNPVENPSSFQNEGHGVPPMPDVLQRLLSFPATEPDAGEITGVEGEKKTVDQAEKDMQLADSSSVNGGCAELLGPDHFESGISRKTWERVASNVGDESSSVIFSDPSFISSTPAKGFLRNRNFGHSCFGDGESHYNLITPADITRESIENIELIPPESLGAASIDTSGMRKKAGFHKKTVLLPEITPLTKEQMMQALIYTLKNDSSFVQTLHENYVKSLNDNLLKLKLSSDKDASMNQ